MASSISSEQPMSKRQRIDAADATKKSANQRAFDVNHTTENSKPPDILPIVQSNNKVPVNATITSINSTNESTSDELDNAAINIMNSMFGKPSTDSINENTRIVEFPDLLKTANVPMRVNEIVPTTVNTPDASINHLNTNGHGHANPLTAPNCSNSNSSSNNSINSNETLNRLSDRDSDNIPSFSNSADSHRRFLKMDDFQTCLMSQCLCKIRKESLNRSFAAHYYKDSNGHKHSVSLNAWPTQKLIQFLSNLEFLFEVYLNQNAKGEICFRIMRLCDFLLLKHQQIIDEIFQLDEHDNQFVQYLAVKVLANCILIAKDKEVYSEHLLTTLMSNLIVHHEPDDHVTLRKISFVLSIILHIMEWKDIKKHPLDDQIVINGREVYNDSDNENFSLPVEIPPIENNYFSIQHAEGNHGSRVISSPTSSSPSSSSSSSSPLASPSETVDSTQSHHNNDFDQRPEVDTDSNATSTNQLNDTSCHLEYLKDSESFDSKDLKYSLTCMLGNKWPALVENMANCATLLQNNRDSHFIENTIITFLTLWERIINVDTCISFDSTLPFHKKLTIFEEILIRGNLPVPIYKQILTLFSASLCYTTTLALQSEVPQETNMLANEIFNSVKSQRIFSSLPTPETEIRNDIGFIGYKHATIVYDLPNVPHASQNDNHENDDANENHFQKSIDFILLQKLVLLILKAIVVTVRPIRSGDSSDSSMDSCSSNSSADHEAFVVERVTRDVFKKLKIFLKNKLNHHPETHLSKVIVHLFNNQDDYLIEAMLCMLGTTITFLPRQSPFGSVNRSISTTNNTDRNQFRELIDMISPVYTFLEFLELINFEKQTMLDLLITDDTCFLLYFLRFLKYIRSDWAMFQSRCNDWMSSSNTTRSSNRSDTSPVLERVMTVLIRLRMKLERLVLQRLFPYDISPMVHLMHQCESFYEGNDHELF